MWSISLSEPGEVMSQVNKDRLLENTKHVLHVLTDTITRHHQATKAELMSPSLGTAHTFRVLPKHLIMSI